MAHDLVIKNGMVVDGSGFFPLSRRRWGEGRQDRRDRQDPLCPRPRTIDAEGLFVSPGIIDTHTHYDAQPFWDSSHLVHLARGDTVLMGNCGLTLAPLRPEHRDAMLATFCCVETSRCARSRPSFRGPGRTSTST